jgi:hypothetical protein
VNGKRSSLKPIIVVGSFGLDGGFAGLVGLPEPQNGIIFMKQSLKIGDKKGFKGSRIC